LIPIKIAEALCNDATSALKKNAAAKKTVAATPAQKSTLVINI
jgi:hypothetical protein